MLGGIPSAQASEFQARAPENGDEHTDLVWDLEFQGNTTFSDLVLANVIATEEPNLLQKIKFWNYEPFVLDRIEVRKDEIRLQRYYDRRGFDLVQVRAEIVPAKKNKPWKHRVIFHIQENAPLVIRRVRWTFDSEPPEVKEMQQKNRFRELLKKAKFLEGQRFQRVHIPDLQGSITNELKSKGFAFASVDLKQQIDSLRRTADVSITVSPSSATYFSDISVTGEKTISPEYIIKEAALEKGEKYSQKKLEEAQRQIFNHHLFRFATISIPDQPHDSTLNLNIRVREQPLRSISLSAGVGREEIVRGEANWTHRNVAHRGHKFQVGARASFIEQRLSVDYQFPYVFNTKSSVILQPFAQHVLEPSFELLRGGINNSFVYRYSRDLTGSVSYEYTSNRELSQQNVISLPDSINTYDRSSFQVSGYYGRGFFQNEDGWVVQPFLEISGLMGSSAFTYEKLSLDVRRYIPVTSSMTLAGRINGGIIFAAQQDSLPKSVRLYAGGTSSVRGWTRQQLGPKQAQFTKSGSFDGYIPTGGRMNMKFNVEVRQQLNALIDGFGMALFLDGGQVWRYRTETVGRPVQFGVGGGFRYNSPIGPIRIDIGYKINPSDADLNIYQGTDYGGRFDRYALHLSIGQAF
jgi:outer membrane protein insertion porin family